MTNKEVKAYKVNSLVGLKPDSFAYLKVPGENTFEIFVTDKEGIPYSLKQVSIGVQNIESSDGSITITGISNLDIQVSSALQLLINSALQSGDNTSELNNDGSDGTSTYVETDELGAVAFSNDYNDLSNIPPPVTGETNLNYIASATTGTVTSDTGTDATLPLVTSTESGLQSPEDKVKLDNITGTNTGDQDLSGYTLRGGYALTSQDLKNDIDAIYQPNALITYTTPTRLGNQFTYPALGYQSIISKVIYTNALEFQTTINPATTDYKRLDAIYMVSGGALNKIQGTEALNEVVPPTIPPGAVLVSLISVFGNTIIDPTPSIGDPSKEDTINKSNTQSDFTSIIKFPTWNAIVTWIKENLFTNLLSKTTPTGTDSFLITDSADSNKTKRTLFSNTLTYFRTFFQDKDNQIEVGASSNVLTTWNGQTVLFTANCTITVPNSIPTAYWFMFRVLPGVTVTWAITSPYTWENTPTPTTATGMGVTGILQKRTTNNTIFLDT